VIALNPQHTKKPGFNSGICWSFFPFAVNVIIDDNHASAAIA